MNRTTRPVTFFIPGPIPGMNEIIKAAKGSGGTGRVYSGLKAKWTNAVAWHAKAAKVPHYDRAVTIHFRWVETHRRRDPDNLAAGKKFCIDGLVAAGILLGDGWIHIEAFSDSWEIGKNPGVEVTIS